MPDGVGEKRELAVVQIGCMPQHPLDLPGLRGLSLDMGVEIFECPQDDLDLVRDEVGEVVSVGLGVEEGAGVAGRSFHELAADQSPRSHGSGGLRRFAGRSSSAMDDGGFLSLSIGLRKIDEY